MTELSEAGSKIDGSRCLAHTTFLVRDRDNLRHSDRPDRSVGRVFGSIYSVSRETLELEEPVKRKDVSRETCLMSKLPD